MGGKYLAGSAFFWWLLTGAGFPLYSKLFLRRLTAADIKLPDWVLPALKKFLLIAEYILLCAGSSFFLAILSYLVCSLSYPFVDQQLWQVDRAIGLDWPAWFHLMQSHFHDNPSGYWVYNTLGRVYISQPYQFVFFAIWFGVLTRKERLYEIFWVLFITIFSIVFISAFLPALGAVSLHEVETLFQTIQPGVSASFTDIRLIYAGKNPDFTSHQLFGIIMFPSFHTAASVIYMYAFRRTGILGYGAVILNLLMLISIPYFGGHHFTDMIGGIGVALASILLVRALSGKYSKGSGFTRA